MKIDRHLHVRYDWTRENAMRMIPRKGERISFSTLWNVMRYRLHRIWHGRVLNDEETRKINLEELVEFIDQKAIALLPRNPMTQVVDQVRAAIAEAIF